MAYPALSSLFLLLIYCMIWTTESKTITTSRQSDKPQEILNPYENVGDIFLVLESHMREVPATFLSVALGSRLIHLGWEHFNTSSSLVRTLSSALSPAILRMGGSSANYLTYDPEAEIENNENNYQHISIPKYDDQGSSYEYRSLNYTNYTMIGDDLNDLLEFVDAVNMTLLWDMNHFYREADGGWDPTNARMIIEEVSRKSPNVIWQLGNEPNSYAAHTEFSITGHQDALDYGVFRRELLSVFPEVTIVGPDTTHPRIKEDRISDEFGFRSDPVDFQREFLTYGNQDIDVVSWHQYYIDGRTSTVEDFMDPNLMDVLIKQLDAMVVVRDELAPGKPIWLTETSSAFGGGAPEMSNRYVAGFLWLDKLGLSARLGVDVVCRQTLYHGAYALLDRHMGEPYPDYWLSVIYKQQVGGKVLDMQLSTSTPTVRLYAHCLNPTSQHYKQGGVVMYGMNVGDKGASVSLQHRLNETQILEMILQPPEGDLQSSSVMLNGVLVELTSDNDLPLLDAHPSDVLGAIHMPAQSMGFWLLPNAKTQACH